MPQPLDGLSRRALIGIGLALGTPIVAWATAPRRLVFGVYRNGAHIGEHQMSFAGDPAAPLVTTEVQMLVRLGPVPVYRYRHHAVERWQAGHFASLETTTDANGKAQKVEAERQAGGVLIQTAKTRVQAPVGASPFTHWNPQALAGPLFNPQEGKMLQVTARRRPDGLAAPGGRTAATLWSVRGEAEIDDWYDADGSWLALKGRLKDGSVMEYRRV
ncbi:DUF6134 family protein [Phenylobacterium aquaticum]|uniref:DUF6134 family protein n=1 Tax=Phenylobacterium aquaticum TaxID=1763816 RepID=UPI0026EB629A|nr:DUF6134 family protein [Phenylobacterium aquaticum]